MRGHEPRNKKKETVVKRTRSQQLKCHYDEKFNFPIPLYLQSRSTYL